MSPATTAAPREVVVDASVLVAQFKVGERSHEDAAAFLRFCRNSGVRIVLPAVAPAEVASAVGRATGNSRLAVLAAQSLRSMPETSIVSVEPRLGWRAAALAAVRGVRGCDAVYAALARHLDVWLVSLDRAHLALSDHRLTAITPGEALARLDGDSGAY